MVLRLTRRRARNLIPALALTFGFALSSAGADLDLQFLAEAALPGDLEVGDTLVGGLSGLTYDPGCDLYYALSDDRGRFAAPRFYTLRVRVDGETAAVDVIASTALRDLDGSDFERGDLDPEALAFHPDGSLFVSSEGIPHRGIPPLVGRFTLDGRMFGAVSLPGHYLALDGGSRGVRDNLGFEGVGLSPGGELLFVAAEKRKLEELERAFE